MVATVDSRQNAGHDIDEDALAVSASPKDENERVLADVAGERISAPLLQEPDHLGVAARGLFEEAQPQRAVGDRAGVTAVDFVIPSSGRPARSSPFFRSTVPPGVPSKNGS